MKKEYVFFAVFLIAQSIGFASAGWFGNIFLSPCNTYDHLGCYNGDVYWFDSCGIVQQQALAVDCGLGVCLNGQCYSSGSTPPQTCTNECTQNTKQCTPGSTSQYQACGNFDSDSCLEWSSSYSCSDGYSCSEGVCVVSNPNNPACTNDCNNFGVKSCIDTTNYHVCGNFDSDSCNDWSQSNSCPQGYSCSEGNCVTSTPNPPSCSNECTIGGPKECTSISEYKVCGNFDSDSCSDWSSTHSCPQGYSCSEGNCVSGSSNPSACTNECTQGMKQCSSTNQYQACGNFDSDSCLEWSSSYSCSQGYTCQEGQCTTSPPACVDTCEQEGEKQCVGESNGYQACGDINGDGCLEWSPLISCGEGFCDEGECFGQGCENDSDCDDGDLSTIDSCVNPGTPNSNCVNQPIEDINCVENSDCGANGFVDEIYCIDDLTPGRKFVTYICQNPGTASSSCSFEEENRELEACEEGRGICVAGVGCEGQEEEPASRSSSGFLTKFIDFFRNIFS